MSPPVQTRRRILCVAPAYEPSFGTMQHSWELLDGVRAFMPPQGILLVAAYLPSAWEVRFVDENLRPATDAEYAWADAVFVSGMHVQRRRIAAIARRARCMGRASVLGGPSVSAAPEAYPDFDYLHLGELGDATDRLIALLDADPSPPASQVRLTTRERLPLSDFPTPAYHLAGMDAYMLASVQFSSGCPYQCEFCDIPALYGRNPRLKRPEQVLGELDAMRQGGRGPHAVYFVDDNFIGNRKAARDLLPHLIGWQKRNGYPLEFACEATLNIAKQPEILELMREANFRTVFCGIESPEIEALQAMRKGHNTTLPILEAVRTLNGYGLEVVSGIILGLDTDTPATPDHIRAFVEASRIPMLTINLLQALPRTPLWDRLAAEGRLIDDPERDSNVDFRLPYDQVVQSWRALVREVYAPEAVYRRFAHNVEHTYPHRLKVERKVTAADLRKGIRVIGKLLLKVGLRADYRAVFWKLARPMIRAGRIEDLIHVAVVAHHLIRFSRDAAAGRENASFYSDRLREERRRERAA